MKVLMVSPSYGLNIGGAEIQLNKLQKRLDNSIETIIISKKSGFLTEKRIFEILPLFFAITVVTFPKLPGLLNNTTTILALDTISKLF